MENTGKVEPGKNNPMLTLQGKVLGTGMLYSRNATTEYELAGSVRQHNVSFAPNEYRALIQEFQHDPFTRLAYGRENLLAIMKDQRLPLQERVDRVKRYTDAYLHLVTRLDHNAFPPDDRVRRGIPDYIPDGLSDMGKDDETNQDFRNREKIRINKAEIFELTKPLFREIFSTEIPDGTSKEQWKKWVMQKVSHYVYTSMPYNYDQQKMPRSFNSGSVTMTDVIGNKLAQCRHHALMTQVLLETFGITSRLMKSELIVNGQNLGPHVNNAVRIEEKWYIVDPTNPETKADGKNSKIFIRPIPETSLDLNANKYEWNFDLENGEKRGYKSRSNMYYRIRDNSGTPTH